MVANLNIRVRADYRMSLGTTQSSRVLETAGERTAEVGLENLAIGIFHQAPCVVSVAILGQVPVDSILAEGDDSINLLLSVGET